MSAITTARTHLPLKKDAPVPRSIERTGASIRYRFSVACTINTPGHGFRQGQPAKAPIPDDLHRIYRLAS